ncbi:DNA-directed RNA polymerase subunit beta [bacterium]|nr:DNA-directed RNA polymerase subunit beta [bacterium]
MPKSKQSPKFSFPLPDLTKIQKDSYKWFFTEGIAEILDEVNPIADFTGRQWILSFSNPRVDRPALSYKEALNKGVTYNAGWYLQVTLEKEGTKQKKTSEQYMGEVPLMSPKGTFIINGVEKVVINQLTRSYGILYLEDIDKAKGRINPVVKVLPKYGAWLEMDISKTNVLNVKIDKRRKFPLTILLRVFGLETDDQIRKAFEDSDTGDVSYIENTLERDQTNSYNEAIIDIYSRLRPGEPEILENAKALIESTFFNTKRYNLGKVGRFKLNQSVGLEDSKNSSRVLTKDDILLIVKKMLRLANNIGEYDIVDDLSNRRVKSVGELLQQQVRVGFIQMERNIRERMSLEPRELLPEISRLISTRPVAAKIQSFFASGQLTQYPDQYNALSTLNLMRRLTVLGPGGLTRERASFAVRDVHYSQYGRIDPIHTPEGPNVGLNVYLGMYSKVNEFGFLETPYRKLEKVGDRIKLTDEVGYMAAYDERNLSITDASVNIDEKGFITDERVPLRKGEEFRLGSVLDAEYMDVVPNQILGLVSGLIPFVANNDPMRSSVACQQTTQAVPLVRPEAPFVGTGLESAAADNAFATLRSDVAGTVVSVDADQIIVKDSNNKNAEYQLDTYQQSNSDTAINFRPVVNLGQKVSKGDLLAENVDSSDGKLAIGANLRVAYMIWDGYNYEDAIVISERVVKDDLLTSITVHDHSVQVQETKLGPEEVTRDIPGVPDYHLRNLDENGVVTVGSRVSSGDLLVGIIQPRGEIELSAEERLLRAIFGEKAKEVKDVSLRVPHGESGVVIGVKEFTREEKEEMSTGVIREVTVYIASLRKIGIGDKLSNRFGNKGVISKVVPIEDMPHTKDGQPVDIVISATSVIGRMNVGQLIETSLGWVAERTGKRFDIPSFTKFTEEDLENALKSAGLPVSGKETLIDGRTGEPYFMPVLVGNQYVLKLHHMSEGKVHARSTGPYSLITQQPLGGKAQFGGQRFGEMEVWAMEAYGVSSALQEMLTIKSDDMEGRNKAMRSILKGEKISAPNLPESFKLLIRELNGLGLSFTAIKKVAPVVEETSVESEEAAAETVEPEVALDVEPAKEKSVKKEKSKQVSKEEK